jgi:hypothetical protein
LIHYLAVATAKEVNPSFEVMMHVKHEPKDCFWWDAIKSMVTMVPIDVVPVEIFGKPIKNYAHSADIIRLQALIEYGGVYLDSDTICVQPFDPLLHHSFVMGIEQFEGQVNGLCNAVIMSGARAPFLYKWYDAYREFNPDGWNESSVQKPMSLARQFPKLIHIEPNESFFKFDWSRTHSAQLHAGVHDITDCYSLHLWESKTWDDTLKYLDPIRLLENTTTYSILARRHLHRLGPLVFA